jgi:hypothetical protein
MVFENVGTRKGAILSVLTVVLPDVRISIRRFVRADIVDIVYDRMDSPAKMAPVPPHTSAGAEWTTPPSVNLTGTSLEANAMPLSGLCPYLCPPPNLTECYRLYANRWKPLLDGASVALGHIRYRFVQVVDSRFGKSF